jgi:hypothetical protein
VPDRNRNERCALLSDEYVLQGLKCTDNERQYGLAGEGRQRIVDAHGEDPMEKVGEVVGPVREDLYSPLASHRYHRAETKGTHPILADDPAA